MKDGNSIAGRLVAAARELARQTDRLVFSPPVTHVYNPLDYAFLPHEAYIRRYAASRKRVVFWGMNPGPWGMAQTGVPFGEVETVSSWMGIEGSVGRPAEPHPKRPIEGFACARSEVSGRRLWGLMRSRFETADRFFASHFVANYCPLVFMEEGGRNRTPDKLHAEERQALFAACDDHAAQVVALLAPEWVIGVGRFAQCRLQHVVETMVALGNLETDRVKVAGILHPSPANPRANRDWEATAVDELVSLGVW